MSDFARLEEKLAKLKAQEVVSRAGRVLKSGGDGVLATILTEMGETILPRRLTFTAGDAAVHFAVANRRCQALLSPVAAVDGADVTAFADQAIANAEDDVVAPLRDYLDAIFNGAGDLTVSSSRLPTGAYPSDIGVPIPQLARAWEVSAGATEDRPIEEIMQDFLKGLDGHATGWLNIVGEEVVGHGGPSENHEALGEQAALFLDGYFAKFEALYGDEGDAVLTVLANDAGGMVFVELGDQSAFVTAPTAALPAIAALWERVTT